MATFTLTPTESDGNVISYVFATESDVWDYVTETLGYEYGMDATNIHYTTVLGYHYTTDTDMCAGHIIGTVKTDGRNHR